MLVPVVVRDAQGRPVGNLTKDDFQLFDKGKRQTIVSFSAVKRAAGAPEDKTTTTRHADSERAGLAATNKAPDRFLIYLFDDLNTTFADLAAVRAAAVRHFKNGLPATGRRGFGTSLTASPRRVPSPPARMQIGNNSVSGVVEFSRYARSYTCCARDAW